jgi:hypothetical protein
MHLSPAFSLALVLTQAECVRRKSLKRGRPAHVFAELVSFPKLVLEPTFCLELALIQEEEVRRYTGKKRWRRHGWQTVERRLINHRYTRNTY